MFAVIKTGGKQYRVTPGDVIDVEKLTVDAGDKVTFDSVLMHGAGSGVTIGTPFIDGAEVVGEVLEQFRGEKVVGLKKRRRKHSSARRWGHRQSLTKIQITAVPGATATAEDLAKSKPAPKPTKPEDEAPKAKAKPPKKKAPKPAPKPAAPAPQPQAEKVAAPEPTPAPEPEVTPAAAPTPEPAAMSYTPADDDLTKLPGVSPEAAIKLQELGITRYKQVTLFRLADWEKFEEALGTDDFSRTSILTQANKLVEAAEARENEG